jgi:predicted negative regulator of RcsB-dependent stress response
MLNNWIHKAMWTCSSCGIIYDNSVEKCHTCPPKEEEEVQEVEDIRSRQVVALIFVVIVAIYGYVAFIFYSVSQEVNRLQENVSILKKEIDNFKIKK